jgi:hypothetical protein
VGVGHLQNRAIPLFIFGGNAEALDGLFQRADFPIKVVLLFYHYVKNVSS